MELIVSLIMVPCVAALLMQVVRADKARDVVAIASALIIGALSIAFAANCLGSDPLYFELPAQYGGLLSVGCVLIELIVGAFIVCYAVRYKRILPLVLAIFQIVVTIWLEATVMHGHTFSTQFRVDSLTVIMVLIIGIVGSGICVYGLGYMKDFQAHHEDQKDRRPWFFTLMFLFLSAMFVLVLSDNMLMIYTAWEVTTLCSFLLIGFTKTEEAINNAFRQIVMNVLGGIGFQIAIVWTAINEMPLIFSEFIAAGATGAAIYALPIALLAFAGMTKAAQMPFHTWLLGAMVAPTPTSALLHSSTMVKAGVFLLIKISPAFLVFPVASYMVVLVGGFTFLFCSLLAISQSNAKRVLAYSTIANLGLITACAGVGTPEAVWAAIFLVIFHAVAKSLLFLCVGTAEHHIGSRNIEDMDEMFTRMPRLARLMMLGIMGMFIAPFGMLVSKWASLVSFISTGNIVLIILLAFGSAATFMFWGKWLGKLAGIAAQRENVELTVHKSEWSSLMIMAILVVCCCVGMPFISGFAVEPYLVSVYMALGSSISMDNMVIMSIIALFITVIMFGVMGTSTKKRIVPAYMAGISVDNGKRQFRGSLGDVRTASPRNWYMEGLFGEQRLDKPGTILCAVLMIAGIVATAAFGASVSGIGSLPMYVQGTTMNESIINMLIGLVAFTVLGPVIGCLFAGIDRKLSARMQGRVGPPLLQPYYDLRKLMAKDSVSVNSVEDTYITCALIFTLLSGGVFFGGGNFLFCVFLITLSALFFILAAFSTRSPYAEVGANREILQVMSYEPMVLLVAVGMYLTLGTFDVAGALQFEQPMIVATIPIFIGLLFILTIKLRKSPFDLSYSHHAHQELVKGISTEMSGRTLAKVEVMHWCESMLFLGWVGMFFLTNNPLSIVAAIAIAILIFFFEIWIDNNFARVKWQKCLKWSWIVTAAVGILNVAGIVLFIIL